MPLSSDTPQHWHHRVTYTGANHTQLVEKSLSNCSDCCLHLLQSLCFSDSQEDWQKASSCTRKVLFPRWEIGAQLWSPGTSKGSVLWTLHEPRRRGSYTHPKTMRGPCTLLEVQHSAGRWQAHEKSWHWRSVHTHYFQVACSRTYFLTIQEGNFHRKGVAPCGGRLFFLLQDKRVNSGVNHLYQQALSAVSHPPRHSALSHAGSTVPRKNAAWAKGLSQISNTSFKKPVYLTGASCQLLPARQTAYPLPDEWDEQLCLFPVKSAREPPRPCAPPPV